MADETDLEISIVTSADTSGAEAAEAAVKDVGDAAQDAGENIEGADRSWEQMNEENSKFASSDPASGLNQVAEASKEAAPALKETAQGSKEVDAGLKEILGKIPGFNALSDIFSKLGGGAIGAVAAGITAIGSAFVIAGKALAEFAEKQTAVSDLDQILANTGQLTDDFRLKLQELADQFEETTGIGDERFLKVMSTLVKFGATSANIDELTQATINLSGAIGVDVERAATIMGKAMHGNVTMLQRYGITVDKNATDTEKLNQVMEQLATRGGGVLESRTHTLSGQFNQISIATGNFFEGLGNLLSRTGVVQDAMSALSTAINFFANLLPKAVDQTSALKNNFDPLRKSMGDAKEGAEGMADGMDKATGAAKKQKDALTEATEAIKANASAAKEAVDASLKLAEAEIKLQVAQGKISKEEGALRIQQLKEETDIKKLLIEQDALRAQQGEMNKTLLTADAEAFQKRTAAFSATQQFEKVSPLRTPEDVLGQASRAGRDVQRLEAMEPGSLRARLIGRSPFGPDAGKTEDDLQAELDAAKKKRDELTAKVPLAQAAITARAGAEGTAGQLESQKKELDPKLNELAARLANLEKEIQAAKLTAQAGTIERAVERGAVPGVTATQSQRAAAAAGVPAIPKIGESDAVVTVVKKMSAEIIRIQDSQDQKIKRVYDELKRGLDQANQSIKTTRITAQ